MQADVYRIEIDGEWTLDDLYDFPHALDQTYAFTYCFDTDLPPLDAERINVALNGYPWAGGYSIVNIYTVLRNQIPIDQRPRINSMHYASPGWIDIVANFDVIVKLATAVATISGSAVVSAKSYASIQKILHDVSLEKRKSEIGHLKMERLKARELHGYCNDLSRFMGYKKFDELVQRTDGDTVIAAKLLSAQYRRVRHIADYEKSGKAVMSQGVSKENIKMIGHEDVGCF